MESVAFGEEILKPDLFQLTERNKAVHHTSKIDRILAEHDHTVLRLQPYHPKINRVKYIWATVKNWVAEKNVNFKLKCVIKLTDESCAAIRIEGWGRKVCACAKY
jgi:transposase